MSMPLPRRKGRGVLLDTGPFGDAPARRQHGGKSQGRLHAIQDGPVRRDGMRWHADRHRQRNPASTKALKEQA